MQIIIFSLTLLFIGNLLSMQSEHEKHQATCKEWGKYLIQAAQDAQVDVAMVYQIAANMKREKCQNEVKGRITKSDFQNLAAFKQAGATLFCYIALNTLYCTHNRKKLYVDQNRCQESDPIFYCNFEFKNNLKRSS